MVRTPLFSRRATSGFVIKASNTAPFPAASFCSLRFVAIHPPSRYKPCNRVYKPCKNKKNREGFHLRDLHQIPRNSALQTLTFSQLIHTFAALRLCRCSHLGTAAPAFTVTRNSPPFATSLHTPRSS